MIQTMSLVAKSMLALTVFFGPTLRSPPAADGSASYQQLVTDGEGNPKWEDRLAYDDSRTVVNAAGILYVHVSDNIGELNATKGAKLCFTLDDGTPNGSEEVQQLYAGGDNLLYCVFCVIALADNANVAGSDTVFPKKGVYFLKDPTVFVSSVANFDESASDTDPAPEPVITWDGSVGTLKKLDKKYTGLFAFSILWDGISNYSATASYQEVRDAYDAKIPIFAQLIENRNCYPATSVQVMDNSISFYCGSYNISYSDDGTIGPGGEQ